MTSAKHVKIEQGEWVVVCDGSKALFLENAGDSKFPNLKTREVLEQKVPPTSEIGSDAPGRSHSSVGHGRSSIEQTDLIQYEWMRIPHFYNAFYVYQYATGLSAALALSGKIVEEGQPAVDRYLRFLSSGSSRPSIDLLRDAGVDMTTPAPIQAAMDTFDRLLDELEAAA